MNRNIFHANWVAGFASGHYPAAEKRHLTKHVEVHGQFSWDAGSIPAASTNFQPRLLAGLFFEMLTGRGFPNRLGVVVNWYVY